MNRLSTTIIATILFSAAASAQTYSLPQCIDYALAHNSGFAATQQEKQKQELSVQQARASYLPTLNGQAEHNFNQGRSLDVTTNEYSEKSFQNGLAGLTAGAELFKGFQRKYNNSLQQHQLDLQMSQIEIARNQLALDVADAYMQALFAIESAASAQLQLDITSAEVAKMQVLADAGVRRKADILRLQAQLESERAELLYQQGQTEGYLLRLKQLMEFKADTAATASFGIVTALESATVPVLLPADSAFAGAKTLPELTAADMRIRSAEEQVNISKSYRSPQLSAHAYYGMQYSTLATDPIGTQIGNNRTAQFGMRLTVPIFNQYQTKTAIARTKIDVLQAQSAKVETEKDLRNRIQSTYLNAAAAQKRLDAAQKSADFYTESFRIAQAQLEAGAINALDFGTEKTALAAAQARVISIKYELLYHSLMLNYFATGTITL